MPVFTRGPAEVARLAEMCADDAAARRSGRPALLSALLAMGTGTAVPAAALAAHDLRGHRAGAPAAAARRRARPSRPQPAALASLTLLLASASGLVTVFAGPIAGRLLPFG